MIWLNVGMYALGIVAVVIGACRGDITPPHSYLWAAFAFAFFPLWLAWLSLLTVIDFGLDLVKQ